MKIIADYHTHSRFSDGKNTIEENVKAAYEKGLKTIAVTEHGPRHMASGCPAKRYRELRQEVDRLQEIYRGRMEILLGVEADIISLEGDIDVTEEMRQYLDIVLLGYHRSARMRRLRDYWHFTLRNHLPFAKEKVVARNTQAYIRAVERNRIDIVTHPGYYIGVQLQPLAAACAKAGTALEISGRKGHIRFSPEEARRAKKTGVRFVIDSDGHTKEQIGSVQTALAFAAEAGLTAQDIINAEEATR